MKLVNKSILGVFLSLSLVICLSSCYSTQTPQPNATPKTEGQPDTPMLSPIARPSEGPAQFAFSAKLDRPSDIFIGNIDGTVDAQLTDDPGDDSCPVYSPDGSRIAFCSDRGGTGALYTMNADGSGQTLLTDKLPGCACSPDRQIRWSPDGKWITLAGLIPQQNARPKADLYIVRSDGSKTTLLTESPRDLNHMIWRPDSKSLLFFEFGENPDIFQIDISSKKIAPLMDQPIPVVPSGFSPEGDQLLVWDGAGGKIGLIDFSAGGKMIPLAGSGGYDSYPAWSGDGQKILYMCRTGDSHDICLMNADGSGQVNLTTGSGVANYWPSISPDGQKIIYLTNSQDQWSTMIMNADGSGKTAVTAVFGVAASISWQP